MEYVAKVVEYVNKFLWDYALLFLLLGAGVVFTCSLKFIQIRKFKEGMKKLFGGFSGLGKFGENGLCSFLERSRGCAGLVGAFCPQCVAGGFLGVRVQKAMRYGVAEDYFQMKQVWVPRLMHMLQQMWKIHVIRVSLP